MFSIGLVFFISFCSNLSISSIDTIVGLKNSSSISLLIFTSLPFNLIKSFSNSKRVFFTFKFGVFLAYFLSIFSQYFCLYSLGFPSLYVHKNFLKDFWKEKMLYSKQFKHFLEWFQAVL